MKKVNVVFAFFMLLFLAVKVWGTETPNSSDDFTIIPGKSVGKINNRTTFADLITLYDKQNVKNTTRVMEEGQEIVVTEVFPKDSEKKLYIFWKNPTQKDSPGAILLKGRKSVWKTNRGITLGTTLKQLEKINGSYFTLTGFGWDYSGTVIDRHEGKITELGAKIKGKVEGRTLLLRLDSDRSKMSDEQRKAYDSVGGDRYFRSDSSAMQKVNPAVYEITISFE